MEKWGLGMQRRTNDAQAGQDGPVGVDVAHPLVIDADTTVSRSCLLIGALLAYVKPSPRRLLEVGQWLMGGSRHAEARLADAVNAASLTLPINQELADFAEQAAAQGRSVYLVSATCRPLLQRAASELPSIAGLLVDERPANGAAGSRAQELSARFPQGFDYAAGPNAEADVWRHARQALLVEASSRAERKTAGILPVAARFPAPSMLAELAKSLRLHQWVKNLIVFVPLVLGGRLTDLISVIDTLLAFVALACIASATYLLNDLWDVVDDRKHWSKRYRPIASGRLSKGLALTVAPAGILLGLTLGAWVSGQVAAMLLLYLTITLAYTLRLKGIAFVDALVLAILFTVRLGLGAVAAQVPPSPWLFVFSMFLFASLSYAKRHTEIARAAARNDTIINGRGYHTIDAPMVLTVGVSAGIGAVLIMVLYIVEEAFRQSFYGSTQWLWGFPVLVYLFITRIWLVSARGDMSDDPVAFALKDKTCLSLLALLAVCFAFAWFGMPWF